MDARAKAVREILHAGDQYLIPFFQRYYSWKRRHWERLRADVWALFEDEDVNSVDYIMEAFPIVKRKDEKQHGEYRIKRVILEIYDAMQNAIDTGQPYQTLLDPPPGPPPGGLPDWQPGQPKPVTWPPHIHPPRYAM